METLLRPVYLVDFLTVGLGVLLGHQLSERRERALQADQEDAERRRLQESLRKELEEIRDNIRDWDGDLPPDIGFPTGSYESGISSGRFALLDEELQQDLNRIYDAVGRVDSQQRTLHEQWVANGDISHRSTSGREFRTATSGLEDRITGVLEDL